MSITTPSNIPKLAARLAKIHVLVVDDDAEIQGLVRSMLRELGFENVTTATDGTEAIRILKRNQRKQEVDLVIADWQMKPLDGLELLKYIRTSAESPNRYLPFIMLTGKGEKQDVEKARDQGFNEYLIKPFTAKALCDRITLCVDQPREFVTTPQYTGPSRRRRGKELPEGVSEDRRRRDSGNRLTGKALKGKIGFEITMKQIFTPQIIAAAQSVADDRQAAFLERVKREMAELFHIYRNAAQVEDPKKYYGKLRNRAFSIKSHAGTFGYDLASSVARSLYTLCEKPLASSEHQLIVIEKHIDTLNTIFQNNIKGDGGVLEKEVMGTLNSLIHKYRKSS